MKNLLAGSNLIIFTTAPTGLGHIRVMDALRDGLPDKASIEEIGVQNIRANKIHALGSRIPVLQKITEFYQTNPLAERLVAGIYRNYLHMRAGEIYSKLKALKAKYPDKNNWVIVSTH